MPAVIPRETFDRIVELLNAGISRNAIADTAGVSAFTVLTIAHGRHVYQLSKEEQERGLPHTTNAPPKPNPTPEEIAAACEAIQATWPPQEVKRWTPPVACARHLRK